MDINLNESESRYYGDLFSLCDVEKIGKVKNLKALEFFRSSNLENSVLSQVIQLKALLIENGHSGCAKVGISVLKRTDSERLRTFWIIFLLQLHRVYLLRKQNLQLR